LFQYEPHEGQSIIHKCDARWRVVCSGRRFGKTYLAAAEALAVALVGGRVMIAGPTHFHSSIAFQEVVNFLRREPVLKRLINRQNYSQGSKFLGFETGGEILTRSTENPDTLLGLGYDLVVFDECAQEPDGFNIYSQFIRPALSDRHGRAIFISTPRYDDWFRDMYDKEKLGEKDWKSFTFPSGPPTVSQEEIENARRELPESIFRQEYLAQFLEVSGAVFRNIDEVAVATPPETADHKAGYYVMGIDIAQIDDWTVVVVLDTRSFTVVDIHRFNNIPYPIQEDMIAKIAKRWRAPHIQVDATNNAAFAEHLATRIPYANVIPFIFSATSKSRLINQLVLAMEQKSIKLLQGRVSKEAQQMLSELRAFARERTPSGMIRMGAPPGKHDDCVTALALALDCALVHGHGNMPRMSNFPVYSMRSARN
jgi:hypothetical protein